MWLLQHVSPFHWIVVTRLRRGFRVSVEGVACIACHLPLWLMDVAGMASLFAFTLARQMVGQREVEPSRLQTPLWVSGVIIITAFLHVRPAQYNFYFEH